MAGKRSFRWAWGLCFLFFLPWQQALPAFGGTGRQIERPVQQAITTRQKTQQAEVRWRQDKEKLVGRLEQLEQHQAQLQKHQSELGQTVAALDQRVSAKQKQLADIEQIAHQINPFLEERVSVLKTRVADDLPFLTEERQRRIDTLERLMTDPDVEISEKYRKVMEAIQVEAEYGFTIETYRETITLEGQPMLADIFRFGRLGLYCLSLDGRQGGMYNPAEGMWQTLGAMHKQALHTAIEIAAKRQPVELLTLPLGRLVVQ